MQFNGVKVFSTTKFREREMMGETITQWLSERPEIEIISKEVRQSSDHEFHCLSIVFFYYDHRLQK